MRLGWLLQNSCFLEAVSLLHGEKTRFCPKAAARPVSNSEFVFKSGRYTRVRPHSARGVEGLIFFLARGPQAATPPRPQEGTPRLADSFGLERNSELRLTESIAQKVPICNGQPAAGSGGTFRSTLAWHWSDTSVA
jgi:hypothetical protein